MQTYEYLKNEKTENAWQCRGYTIANPVTEGFMRSTKNLWLDLVIPASVSMCRQWGNVTVYCTFSTTQPVGGFDDRARSESTSSQIGRADAQLWEPDPAIDFIGGPGFKAPAIPATLAESIGLLNVGSVDTFLQSTQNIDNVGRPAVTPSQIRDEQERIKEHKSTVSAMKAADDRAASDELKSDLFDAYISKPAAWVKYFVYKANDGSRWILGKAGEGVGYIAGKAVEGVGFVLGKSAALALSALGPAGIIAIGIAGYLVTTRVILPRIST